MAPKEPIIIHGIELGKPYMPLWQKKKEGRDPVKGIEGIEGIGSGKKRMSICNGLNRGYNFAPAWKGAELPVWCSIVWMKASLWM
jgi:hypothetical protein